jgi:hypothetical protein
MWPHSAARSTRQAALVRTCASGPSEGAVSGHSSKPRSCARCHSGRRTHRRGAAAYPACEDEQLGRVVRQTLRVPGRRGVRQRGRERALQTVEHGGRHAHQRGIEQLDDDGAQVLRDGWRRRLAVEAEVVERLQQLLRSRAGLSITAHAKTIESARCACRQGGTGLNAPPRNKRKCRSATAPRRRARPSHSHRRTAAGPPARRALPSRRTAARAACTARSTHAPPCALVGRARWVTRARWARWRPAVRRARARAPDPAAASRQRAAAGAGLRTEASARGAHVETKAQSMSEGRGGRGRGVGGGARRGGRVVITPAGGGCEPMVTHTTLVFTAERTLRRCTTDCAPRTPREAGSP